MAHDSVDAHGIKNGYEIDESATSDLEYIEEQFHLMEMSFYSTQMEAEKYGSVKRRTRRWMVGMDIPPSLFSSLRIGHWLHRYLILEKISY